MTDKEQIIYTEEICPYCDSVVELPPFKGIYQCPECKELIVCCSMCEEQSCNNCKYTLLTQCKEQLARKTQECEELLKENQQLRNSLSDSLMFKFTGQENETNRYRKALEEIKKVCIEDTREFADGTTVRYDALDKILIIIYKAKGEENVK